MNIKIVIIIILSVISIFFSEVAKSLHNSKPLKVLVVTGGGPWHDYENQKDQIVNGLLERISNVEFTIDHEGGLETDFKFSRHDNMNWAIDFDLVVYNQCHLFMDDAEYVERIIAAHVKYQIPAVMLHCAMHVYQNASDKWFDFTGAVSYVHEKENRPFTVEVLEPNHPIMVNFPRTWRTIKDELYINVELKARAIPLARAYSSETESYHDVAWTNEYKGVRIFSNSLGHNNALMGSDVNLNLIASGLLWAANKLEEDGTPLHGYEGERGLGWISLWDGETLNGWRASETLDWANWSWYSGAETWSSKGGTGSDSFRVDNDKIIVHGPRSYLFYEGPIVGGDFRNFEFKTDVFTLQNTNAGIYFRTRYQDKGTPRFGYKTEIKTINDNDYNLIVEESNWHVYHIKIVGNSYVLNVDGKLLMNLSGKEDSLNRGTIALQSLNPDSRVYFRNLLIRLWPD